LSSFWTKDRGLKNELELPDKLYDKNGHEINIISTGRGFSEKTAQNEQTVAAQMAWDGASELENELHEGGISASDDPAFAAASSVTQMGNAHMNPNLLKNPVIIYKKDSHRLLEISTPGDLAKGLDQTFKEKLAKDTLPAQIEAIIKQGKAKPESVHQAFVKLEESDLYSQDQLKQAQQQVYKELYKNQEKWRWIKTGVAAVLGLAVLPLLPIALGAIAYLWTLGKKNAPWQKMTFKGNEYQSIKETRQQLKDVPNQASAELTQKASLFNQQGELRKSPITKGDKTAVLMTKEQADRVRWVKRQAYNGLANTPTEARQKIQQSKQRSHQKATGASKDKPDITRSKNSGL
jgi:hypothetical protein